jgi:GNAT superfamily N-acetyltransferase
MAEGVVQGNVDLNDHWLLESDDGLLAAWSRIAGGAMVLMRSVPNLSDAAAIKILESLETSAPDALLILKRSLCALFIAPAEARGWHVEGRSKHFSTPLRDRDDLSADADVFEFPLDELGSERFKRFFDALEVEQALPTTRARFGPYDRSSVHVICDGDTWLGAGIVGLTRGVAVMDVLGVRGRGVGMRLHRHLMWVARGLADEYVGATDTDNAAMLGIFARNGCVENDEQVNLRFDA